VAIRPGVPLVPNAREDAEAGEKLLDTSNETLRDHIHANSTGTATDRYVPFRLEEAAQVGGYDWERGREEPIRNPHLDTASQQIPTVDEFLESVAVKADPATIEGRIPRRHRSLV
jgi:hypothetical protein